jgi:hypothetical protein
MQSHDSMGALTDEQLDQVAGRFVVEVVAGYHAFL